MSFDEICLAFRRKEFIPASECLVREYADHLTTREIADLARALADSGETINLPAELGPYADVPSTGGPASLTTLLCPVLLAAAGVYVPKISATGSVAGAIDSLALIPGFNAALSNTSFVTALRSAGIAHCAQTESICPADGALIAVRRRMNAMRHRKLAAASLLSKKLVVPGTAAVFDFRLGASGNIGDDESEGRKVAKLFLEVAAELGMKVAVALTTSDSFPCSVCGRLESLSLLCDILQSVPMANPLDQDHVGACVKIAGRARALATGSDGDSIGEAIDNRSAWSKFVQHLEAQGSSLSSLECVLSVRDQQKVKIYCAANDGYWCPPDINAVKSWFKYEQQTHLSGSGSASALVAEHQFGVRLLIPPGGEVRAGQPVLEVRIPGNARIKHDDSFLSGTVTNRQMVTGEQVVAIIN